MILVWYNPGRHREPNSDGLFLFTLYDTETPVWSEISDSWRRDVYLIAEPFTRAPQRPGWFRRLWRWLTEPPACRDVPGAACHHRGACNCMNECLITGHRRVNAGKEGEMVALLSKRRCPQVGLDPLDYCLGCRRVAADVFARQNALTPVADWWARHPCQREED